LRVVDVVLRGNHTRTSQPGSPTASFVAKFLNTRGTVLDNIESSANNGAGFWLDSRNIDYVIRHSYFHDNRSQTGSITDEGGRGIYTEVNWPAGLIESNVFTGNFGPAIDVANSSGITIRHNLFSGNNSAVRLSEWDRGYHADGALVYPLQDITITHNQIRDWNSAAGSIHSSASKTGFRLPASHGILADYNVYQPVRRTTPLAFWWNTAEAAPIAHMNTIEDMRSKAGWEQNGRIASSAVQ
jgi:parallel beta-helix repeat protein